MSSITGGPVPAYISVGGSKAVAVFRALAGSAFSQRRSLSAVESRTASFSMLFSVKINISRAFFLVKWGNLPFSGRRFPLSLQAGPEDVPGHRCVEQPLHFLPSPGLPQDPHELSHHGLRGHVVGLQHPQIAFEAVAHVIHPQVAALILHLGGENDDPPRLPSSGGRSRKSRPPPAGRPRRSSR